MNEFDLITRAAWGAKAPTGTVTRMSRYDGFVIHHSAGPRPTSAADGISVVRGIQRFHQDDRGWVDIGYNFLIDGAGRIYQGRPEIGPDQARGAHSPTVNAIRLGICVLGSFHGSNAQTPTAAQTDAVVRLCRHLIVRYWILDPRLSGHRDHRVTDCPGDALYALLPQLRTRIAGAYTLTLPDVGA